MTSPAPAQVPAWRQSARPGLSLADAKTQAPMPVADGGGVERGGEQKNCQRENGPMHGPVYSKSGGRSQALTGAQFDPKWQNTVQTAKNLATIFSFARCRSRPPCGEILRHIGFEEASSQSRMAQFRAQPALGAAAKLGD